MKRVGLHTDINVWGRILYAGGNFFGVVVLMFFRLSRIPPVEGAILTDIAISDGRS